MGEAAGSSDHGCAAHPVPGGVNATPVWAAVWRSTARMTNWIDLVIVLIILVEVLLGLRVGFLRGVLDLAMVIAGILAGAVGYRIVADPLGRLLHIEGNAVNVLAFVLVVFIVQGILSLVVAMPLRAVLAAIRTLPPARWLDALLGIVPGAGKGMLLASLLVVTAAVLPVGSRVNSAFEKSVLGQALFSRATMVTYRVQNLIGLDIADFTTRVEPGTETTHELPFTVSSGLTVNSEDEQEMLDLVNQERARHGLASLTIDPLLQEAARDHSREMFEFGYFGHDSPVTGSPSDRLDAVGAEYMVTGENLAYSPDVDVAHQGLMDSTGHRANILSSEYRRVGIGVIESPSRGKMFTQEFAN